MTTTLQRTDAELKGAITEERVWTAGLNSANIGVAVDDGAVTLSGEVESDPEKLRAEHALDLSVDVPGGEVKATVHDHAITLSGKVAWHYQSEAAARAVQTVPGSRPSTT